MVALVRLQLEPTPLMERALGAFVQEDDLGGRGRGRIVVPCLQCRPGPRRPVAPREQQQRIGLPQAQFAPVARLRVGDIQNEIVGALESVKPVTRPLAPLTAQHKLSATESPKLLRETQAKCDGIHLQPVGHYREGLWSCVRSILRPLQRFDTVDQVVGDAAQALWMARHQLLERSHRESGDFAVAQGDEGRGSPAARNDLHFAGGLAGADLPRQPGAASG